MSGVKKTVRGTVFRREDRDGYCRIRRRSSRPEYAERTHPFERAKKKSRIYSAFLFVLLSFLYVFILFSLKRERLFRRSDKRLTVLSIINLRQQYEIRAFPSVKSELKTSAFTTGRQCLPLHILLNSGKKVYVINEVSEYIYYSKCKHLFTLVNYCLLTNIIKYRIIYLYYLLNPSKGDCYGIKRIDPRH